MSDVTRLLGSVERGDPNAAGQLLVVLYDELRRMAAAKMAREAPGQTLQPTALVHEAWLRLTGNSNPQQWEGRGHFFAAAAEAMRRILIERARRRASIRHGGGQQHVDIAEVELAVEIKPDELLAVDEALEKLAAAEPRKAELVKLRYYAGLTLEESAELLNISVAAARRDWTYARAWLFREISNQAKKT